MRTDEYEFQNDYQEKKTSSFGMCVIGAGAVIVLLGMGGAGDPKTVVFGVLLMLFAAAGLSETQSHYRALRKVLRREPSGAYALLKPYEKKVDDGFGLVLFFGCEIYDETTGALLITLQVEEPKTLPQNWSQLFVEKTHVKVHGLEGRGPVIVRLDEDILLWPKKKENWQRA